MNNKIIIGSRGSELALWQANYIKRQLEKKNRNLNVEIKVIKTKGDNNNKQDSWQVNKVIGKATIRIPLLGYIKIWFVQLFMNPLIGIFK